MGFTPSQPEASLVTRFECYRVCLRARGEGTYPEGLEFRAHAQEKEARDRDHSRELYVPRVDGMPHEVLHVVLAEPRHLGPGP